MIIQYQQEEISEISCILSQVGVLPQTFVVAYLTAKGKDETQIKRVINQMIKRKLMFYDETQTFFFHDKTVSMSSMDKGKIKALWLYLSLIKNIGHIFIQFDAPRVLTFENINSKDTLNPFYEVFYIPYNSENLCCFDIKSKHSNLENGKVFIIIDDESQIPKITVPSNLTISGFVKVDDSNNGKVTFYKTERTDTNES